MRKRRILGIIIGICLLLEGCGTGNEDTDASAQKQQHEEAVAESASTESESEKGDEQTEDAGSENETEQAAEDAEKEEVSWPDVSYMTAYRRFLKAYVEEENEFAHRARVALALIDDDNVPELILIQDNSHAAGVKVYTYYQKSVTELGEFGSMGSMQYVERGGMILSGFTGMGECDTAFYQVEAGEAKPVCSLMSYEQPDGLYELYEIDGVRVTEAEHDKKWEELYNAGKYIVIGYDDAFAIQESEIADLLAEAQNALLLKKESPRLAELVAEQSEVLEGYGTFLTEYASQKTWSDSKEVPGFALIYLDGDDVPELIMIEGSGHPCGGYVYTFEEGEVIPVGEEYGGGYGEYGAMTYREKEGIVFGDFEQGGNVYSNVYQIEGKKDTLLQSYSERWELSEEGEELLYTYTVDGKEVSEEQYREVCDKWNKNGDKMIQYDDCRKLTGGDIQSALTEELENLILAQEEVQKQNVLIAAGAHESNILLLDYDDYDMDGKWEMFMICGCSFIQSGGWGDETWYHGTLYFAGSDGCTLALDNSFGTYRMIDGKMKFSPGRKYLFFYTDICFTANISEIWTVRDGKPVEESELYQSGQVVYRGENERNEFEIWVDAYDGMYDIDDDLRTGHTWKPYFYHYNDRDDCIEAYGGEMISKDEFEELSGTNLIEEIEAGGYTVGDIIRWENDIVTINYNHVWNAKEDSSGSVIYDNVIWDNNVKDFWRKEERGVTSWEHAGEEGSYRL